MPNHRTRHVLDAYMMHQLIPKASIACTYIPPTRVTAHRCYYFWTLYLTLHFSVFCRTYRAKTSSNWLLSWRFNNQREGLPLSTVQKTFGEQGRRVTWERGDALLMFYRFYPLPAVPPLVCPQAAWT
jgi:hypothetical protein